jgi:hypothetical protein
LTLAPFVGPLVIRMVSSFVVVSVAPTPLPPDGAPTEVFVAVTVPCTQTCPGFAATAAGPDGHSHTNPPTAAPANGTSSTTISLRNRPEAGSAGPWECPWPCPCPWPFSGADPGRERRVPAAIGSPCSLRCAEQ